MAERMLIIKEPRRVAREPSPQVCQQCGMACDRVAEFHPYAFCVWKKAGLDPWETLRWVTGQLGLGKLPAKPPLVRDLQRHV